MKLKWLGLSILFFFAAFVAQKEYTAAPNQEISIDLESVVASKYSTLEQLQNELTLLGVENISISKNDTSVTISYYSVLNVVAIQKALQSTQKDVKVSTITKSQDLPSGFNDKLLTERKTEADRFVVSSFNALLKASEVNPEQLNGFKTVSFSLETKSHTSNTLHNIPEVRAGPFFI